MFQANSSLIDLQTVTPQQIEKLFSLAESLKQNPQAPRNHGEYAILAFFEASTRTRLSFEAALAKVGVAAIVFDGGLNTSLEKGETIEDSILNMAAMQPRLMIVRCGQHIELQKFSQQFNFPVLNAGWGVKSHPTQALLDLMTLKQKWLNFVGKRLLIVGDVKHSRVASSHIELASKLGIEIAQCGPQDFLSENSQYKTFHELKPALAWADAVMALRFQFERHAGEQSFQKEDYRKKFGISSDCLKSLKKESWILHPGPINQGIELEAEVLSDPRSLVMNQVSNGVYLREALLRMALGEFS